MSESFITGVGIPFRRVTRQDLDDLVNDTPTQPPYCLRSLNPNEFGNVVFGHTKSHVSEASYEEAKRRHFTISNVEQP